MTIDKTKLNEIIARGEKGRREGASLNEKLLGQDIEVLLEEIRRLNTRRDTLEDEVSNLSEQLWKCQQRLGNK